MSEFVPFKIAKKLEEKGFNLPIFEIYGKFDSDGFFHSQLYCNYCETMDSKEIVAPTISQVLKWLRVKKKLHIMIDIWKVDLNNTTYKWGYDIVNLTTTHVEGSDTQCANSFEQASLAGIEYILDNNLI